MGSKFNLPKIKKTWESIVKVNEGYKNKVKSKQNSSSNLLASGAMGTASSMNINNTVE
jgi:N-acetylmuramoyl-L-alanine amidase CwlA